jgi:hypothetical protein
MVISTEGLEGSGKTDFLLRNTPRPVVILDFDFGTEGPGTREPALAAGVTRKELDLTLPAGIRSGTPEAVRHVRGVMDGFLEEFRKAIGVARTLGVDTFTAAWAGQRLARKDTDSYAIYEEEFKSLIRLAYRSETTNLILVHHMVRDWKRSKEGAAYKGDTYSRDGMDGVLFAVQLAIRQSFGPPMVVAGKKIADGEGFQMDILKCRDNQGLVGTRWPAMSFPELCGIVCPDVDWAK